MRYFSLFHIFFLELYSLFCCCFQHSGSVNISVANFNEYAASGGNSFVIIFLIGGTWETKKKMDIKLFLKIMRCTTDEKQ